VASGSGQFAAGQHLELARTRIGGAAVGRLHRQIARPLDHQVERIAGGLEGALAGIMDGAVIEHERGLVGGLHGALGLLDIFAEDRLLALEADRVHVGEVVRRDIHATAKGRLLAQQHVRRNVHRTSLKKSH
jgi:hypothetical protein